MSIKEEIVGYFFKMILRKKNLVGISKLLVVHESNQWDLKSSLKEGCWFIEEESSGTSRPLMF